MDEEETLMRTYKKAIILLVVVALLGGLYFFATTREAKKPDEKPDTTTSEKINIFSVEKEKISEVSVVNKEGKIVITRKDKTGTDGKVEKEWVLTTPADFKADKQKVDSLVSTITTIDAERIIEESSTELAKYGFNEKSIQITIKYDGGVKELEIGDETSTKDAYYVKEKGNSKVYTVASYTVESLRAYKEDLRDKSILTIKPEEVIGFSMSKGGNLVFTSRKKSDTEWALTAPIEVNGDVSKIAEMLDKVSKVTSYKEFIEEKATDLDKYGLKNPAYTLEMETATGKTKILLGNEKTKGGEVYAKLSTSEQVVTLDVSTLDFLDKPLKEIMEVFAYIVNIQDVSKIVVEMDGKTTTSEIVTDATDKENDKFTVNGKDANVKDEKDNSLFRKYYQQLIGVIINEIDPTGKPTGKPEITITYMLKKDPGVMKVEFIPKDENYYYVVKNGKYANVLVAKKQFDEPDGLRDSYKKLMDALNKK